MRDEPMNDVRDRGALVSGQAAQGIGHAALVDEAAVAGNGQPEGQAGSAVSSAARMSAMRSSGSSSPTASRRCP